MILKKIKKKLKEYIDKKFYEEINSRLCWKKEELTEEEYRRILYKIKYGEEIIQEYGSLEKWDKVMDKSGFKPYMYHYMKDLKE